MANAQKQGQSGGDDSAKDGGHVAPPPVLDLKTQAEAMRDGRLVGLRCRACGHAGLTPVLRCTACGARDLEHREFSTTGKVVSATVQTVASEQFMNEAPYAYAIIQLDDGPRVSGWVPWIAKPGELSPGSRVKYTSTYKPGMMFEKSD